MKCLMVFMVYVFFVFALSACGGGGSDSGSGSSSSSSSSGGSTSIKVKIQDDFNLAQNYPNLLIHLKTSDFGKVIEEQKLNLLENNTVIFDKIEPGTYGVEISNVSLNGSKKVISITNGENVTLFYRYGQYGNYVTIGNLTIRQVAFIVDVLR